MDEIKKALETIVERIKALETAGLRIKVLKFGDGTLVVPKYSADPGSPEDGQIWYNTTSDKYKGCENGTVVTFTTS